MKSRITHVDIAKGISISLVVLNHSRIQDFFPVIMSAMSLFRMPLFFFLSGVFFSYALSPKEFFLKKLDTLLKPYFFVLLLVFIFSASFIEGEHFWQLTGMFYGTGETVRWGAMWFLPHLFVIYIFTYILFYFVKFNHLSNYFKWLCVLLFLFIGVFYIDLFWDLKLSILNYSITLPGLPFSLDIILATSFYFISGYLLKEKIINFNPNFFVFFVSLVTLIYISFFTDAYINFNDREYIAPVIATLASILGIYLIIFLSSHVKHMKYIKYIFTVLGKGSLFILIFHMPINQKIHQQFEESAMEYDFLFMLAFSAFILSLITPLFIRWLVLRNRLLKLFFIPLSTKKSLQGGN